MNEALRAAIEKFKALGLWSARSGRGAGANGGILLHPHSMSVDDLGTGEELESAPPRFEAVRLRDGSEKVHTNRLEELRSIAALMGVPARDVESPQFSNRLFTFTGSDEAVDRYGSRLLVDGGYGGKRYGQGWKLDNFLRAPRFMPFHEYDTIPAGRSLDTWVDKRAGTDDKRLRFQILMDPGPEAGGASSVAPLLTNAYQSRLMESVSVGWWPDEVHLPANDEERSALGLPPHGMLFATSELWELSAVSIPGNPNARMENGVGEEQVEKMKELAAKADEAKVDKFARSIRSAWGLPIPEGRRIFILPGAASAAPPTPPAPKRDGSQPAGDEDGGVGVAPYACPSCGGGSYSCADCGYVFMAATSGGGSAGAEGGEGRAATGYSCPGCGTASIQCQSCGYAVVTDSNGQHIVNSVSQALDEVLEGLGVTKAPEGEARGSESDRLQGLAERLDVLLPRLEAAVERLEEREDDGEGNPPASGSARGGENPYSTLLSVVDEVIVKARGVAGSSN